MSIPNPFQFEGAVTGANFCDREETINALIEYMKNGANVIISKKRRVGKRSLIKEIFDRRLKDTRIVHGYIDIYSATSIKDLYDAIKDGVEQVVGGAMKLKIAQQRISDAFAGASITLTVGASPKMQIEFTGNDYSALIRKMLVSLQGFASDNNLSVVLAIDEFQKIAFLEEHESIEANLRTAMQDAKKICFVMSGSNQTQLDKMFSDARPLYRQGTHLHLVPIEREMFRLWVIKKFKRKSITISSDAFDTIYDFANTEAKIVQQICFELFWRKEELFNITKEDVCEVVEMLYKYNSEIAAIFGGFNLNRQRMLKVIAYCGGKHVTVSPYIAEVGLKHGTVSALLKKMLSEHKIVQNGKDYEIVDTELKLWILVQKSILC